ncbi:MAG: hypothetical protein AUH85_03075 [Chloroflexi bacterium 13_1_40CM_4_68_4]|nr:MAG: hypothetical protein AUH85_03075 [Chloroflexi bacterium 13_1_40CM_4_68_4]
MNGLPRPDRIGLGFAFLVAAAYFLLGAPWLLAIGAGVLVYGLKAAVDHPVWRWQRTPPPLPGSAEAHWLARAELALSSIERLRRSARSEVIATRCDGIAMQAELSVGALRRLTYQAGVVSGISRSSEIAELRVAEDSTRRQLGSAAGPLRDELERTAASLSARRDAAERLDATRRALHERIESSALGLEGVVARLAEIVAISDESSRGTPVNELVSELETLRTALAETEELGRRSVRALSAPIDEGR